MPNVPWNELLATENGANAWAGIGPPPTLGQLEELDKLIDHPCLTDDHYDTLERVAGLLRTSSGADSMIKWLKAVTN